MIIYTSKDSFLEIPKGLGNLGGNSGGGSGEDLGPLSGSVVELSAVTESEAVKLADLSASTENLASSVGSMATGLEAVSGSVETLTDTVDSQGDSIADLLLDVDGLDGRVSGNTSDIEALSAQTSANTADIAALSGVVETNESAISNLENYTQNELAPAIGGIGQDLEALSAVTSGLASTVSEMAGKQASIYDWDAFWASDDYSERRAIYSAFTQDFAQGKMVFMKGTTSDGSLIYLRLEKVNTSNPYLASFRYESDGGYTNIYITSAGNESGDRNNQGKLTRNQLAAASASTLASSAYTRADSAYTLASSAYTLADSLTGQTGGGPDVYILNLMTQQERLALYTELAAYRDTSTYIGIQSGFPAQDYAFYYWAGQDNSDEFNDRFRGFVPMQLAAIHPDDYGGACFFTGVVYGRQGGGTVVMVRYIIASDGSFDLSRGMNEYNPHPEISVMKIDSGGTFSEDLWSLGNLGNTDITYRLWLRVDDGTNFAQSPMQEYRKAYEEISADNWRDVYYFSALIPIGSTTYKGQWRIVQTDDWEGDGPYPAVSWVAQ